MPARRSPLALASRWLLWLWMAGVIVAAFRAPLAAGFAGLDAASPQTSRIVFFHVPIAITSFVAFMVAAVWSGIYLWRRRPNADRAAAAAVEIGLVFCVLAIVTGALWAEVQWGAFWNWDPRQVSIAIAILFYGAYLNLRGALDDEETRARLSAAYAVLGFVVAPFLFFIMPRLFDMSLHPTPGTSRMEPAIGMVVLASTAGFVALFFWMQGLRRRILTLAAQRRAIEIPGEI
ncbi:MAG: cytochrome c biogenesis protein CcsA [Acidobacteriota bacterium]